MHRRRGRVLAILAVVGLLAAAGGGAAARACSAPVEVYPLLAGAAAGPAPATAAEPAGPGLPERAWRAAVGALLRVKQDNRLAFPAHVVAARTLELAGCDRQAVRTQWLKAGLHATSEEQARQVAEALALGASRAGDLEALRSLVAAIARREAWSDGLRRVEAILQDWAVSPAAAR